MVWAEGAAPAYSWLADHEIELCIFVVGSFPEVSMKIFKECETVVSPSASVETHSDEYASATGTISTQGSVSELESIGLPKHLSLTVKQLEMAAVQRTYDVKVSMK